MPIVDTRKTPKPFERFDNSPDRIASSYAMFWADVRRKFWTKDGQRPRSNGLAGARAHVRKHFNSLSGLRPQFNKEIRSQIAIARQFRKITTFDLEAIETLLNHGAMCEAHLHDVQTDKQTERMCFMRLRKIQSHAWQSISRFGANSREKRRVFGFNTVRKTLLRLADLRAKELQDAQEKISHGKSDLLPGDSGQHLSAFYGHRASNAKPERLLTVLAEIEQHDGKPLPENWNLLLFGLRSFFFEADEHVEPRDVLKVNGRLRDYAHRGGLSMMLDVFNTYSYLRLVRGRNENDSLEFACRIVSPPKSNDYVEARDLIIKAMSYKKRFEMLFPTQLP
jgi:hypothetical protein